MEHLKNSKDGKLTIRCETKIEDLFKTVCFQEKKAYGDLLKEMFNAYLEKMGVDTIE